MKIEPTHKPLGANAPKTASNNPKIEKKSDFAQVLGASMQHASAGASDKAQAVPSVTGLGLRIQDDIRSVEWRAADGLLDALDAYRNQLGNPAATLKMVDPYVEKMQDLLESNEKVLDQMADGNPVKQILQQTMVHVSKEIERFKLGHYVDAN